MVPRDQRAGATRALDDLTREVRALFHALARETDRLHEEVEITAAERGVLETLVEQGPLTVPAIARHKGVSRQHIQTLANRLLESGWIEPQDNPAHQRSHLLHATDAGRSCFADLRQVENERLREIAWHLSEKNLRACTRLLGRIRAELDAGSA